MCVALIFPKKITVIFYTAHIFFLFLSCVWSLRAWNMGAQYWLRDIRINFWSEQINIHTHSSNSYKWRSINLMNKIQPTVPLMGHVNIIDILLLLLHDCVIRKFIVEINRPKHLCRRPYSIHGSYFFFLLSVAAVAAGWWCFFFRLEIWFSVMRTITVWWWHVFSINHRTTISGFSKQMMLLLINARRRKNTHMKRRRNFFSVCELCACVNHFRNRKRCFFFLLWHLGSWKMSSCYVLRANM